MVLVICGTENRRGVLGMLDIDENILETFLLGNFSQLDKNDLIKLACYFERLSKGEE